MKCSECQNFNKGFGICNVSWLYTMHDDPICDDFEEVEDGVEE